MAVTKTRDDVVCVMISAEDESLDKLLSVSCRN